MGTSRTLATLFDKANRHSIFYISSMLALKLPNAVVWRFDATRRRIGRLHGDALYCRAAGENPKHPKLSRFVSR